MEKVISPSAQNDNSRKNPDKIVTISSKMDTHSGEPPRSVDALEIVSAMRKGCCASGALLSSDILPSCMILGKNQVGYQKTLVKSLFIIY